MNAEEKHADAVAESAKVSESGGWQHPEVLAELSRLQERKTGWGNAIAILAVSILLFLGAGAARWSWKFVLMLIPILLFHEAGHYIAMRIFKYRNLRMFFIPFLGAAVSGQHFNVAGWKKAIVSLMGPVPGIVLGVMVGAAGLAFENDRLLEVAMLTLILNGFNLLPVLPLDGGWIFHTIVFSRHYVLDAAFRGVASAALIVGGLASGDRVLWILGVFMLIGLPVSFRLARIASNLRRSGLEPSSPDDLTIPPEKAQVIIGELRKAFPRHATNKILAQHTLNIFETLNARPPGWLASILLLGVHAASVIIAVIFAAVFMVGRHGDLRGFLNSAMQAPRHAVACGSISTWAGSDFPASQAGPRNTIVAALPDRAGAEKAFQTLTNTLPPSAAARIFGQALLVTLPAGDDAARKEWVARLQGMSTNLFVDSTNVMTLFTLTCLAPDATVAAEIEREVHDYLSANLQTHLIPPWHPSDSRTSREREEHNLARSTFTALQGAAGGAGAVDSQTAWFKKIAEAQRQGDHAEAGRLQREFEESLETARRQAMEDISSGKKGAVHRELAELYLALPSFEDYTNRENRIERELGPLMGQVAMENGKPVPGEDRYSTLWGGGGVDRDGLLLTFTWLSFRRIFDGPPAMVDWLCARGCIEVRYGFNFRKGTPYEDVD